MIALGILFLLGWLVVALAFAGVAGVCFLKRRWVAAVFCALSALCALCLIALSGLSFTGQLLAGASSEVDTRDNSPVSAQDLVGSWGEGQEAVTFHDDGSARAADGTRWRWRQSARNAFVMSSASAERVPDRCWIAMRDDEEVLLLPVDGCFDDARGWSAGDALRRRE